MLLQTACETALKKQPPEDEVWLVVIWKKGEHSVHKMRRFLVPGERKGYQSLESLIVIQHVESDQMLSEYTIGSPAGGEQMRSKI